MDDNYCDIINDHFFFLSRHTSKLESFNSIVLKYAPKRIPMSSKVAIIKLLCVISKFRKDGRYGNLLTANYLIHPLFKATLLLSSLLLLYFVCAETYLYNILKLRNVEILSHVYPGV